NQKRVDKSLTLELFGYDLDNEPSNTWSPEKLAVFLTRSFACRYKKQPAHGRAGCLAFRMTY
ncbi:MAG: hypothetical protein IIX11_02130, partial [Selenomonadales bacterium]|nr:hypothetical protein [Selenomonadales bacterium]